MVEDDDDRLAFFDTEDFAIEIEITPQAGAPITVTPIFDAPIGLRDNVERDGARISGNSPQFRCPAAQVAGVRAGRATAVMDGVSYYVHRVAADGTGMALVELKKQ